MHRLKSVALLFALLALPLRLSAQTIHGELLELDSRSPVGGALVLLVDESGVEAAGVFSNEHGRFLIQAPAPGRYSLRAERIGLKTTSSPVVDVGAGMTVNQLLLLPLDVRKLAGLEVKAESRCTVRPELGDQTAALWENARKALRAARWGEGLYRFQIRQYQRSLDVKTLRIVNEEAVDRAVRTNDPYTAVPAEQLAREGYVTRDSKGGYIFNAPDAKVLLSDSFLDGHCFMLEPGKGKSADLEGLAFVPSRKSHVVDVKGVLWMDRETGELRSLDYQYTDLPLDGPMSAFGGALHFERLPEGPWIVREWSIRAPVIGAERVTFGSSSRTRPIVVGVREIGARITEVVSLTPKKTREAGGITGTVVDATGARPVVGGTVFLDGTSFSAMTDEQGRFHIAGVREGRYTLRFFHPDLNSSPPPQEVVLGRGESVEVKLRIP